MYACMKLEIPLTELLLAVFAGAQSNVPHSATQSLGLSDEVHVQVIGDATTTGMPLAA